MKALIWDKKNEIKLIEKDVPRIKNNRDAIIKVKVSSICTSDLHIKNGNVPKAKPGVVLGHEFVGEVIDIGSGIKNLKIGDRVCANCETFCGECYYCKHGCINNCINGGWELGCTIDGAQAEYVRVPYADTGLIKLPDNVSYEDAVFVGDILSSGYFGAELCEIKPDDTIAVIGAGAVGLCAMMCAKIFGCKKVIALDIDESRLKIAKQQGLAEIIINPEKEDYLKIIQSETESKGADGVIECAGTEQSFKMSWEIARANAIIGIVAMYEQPLTLPLPDMYGKNLTFKTGGVDAIHCEKLVKLISEGKLNTNFLITNEVKIDEIIKAYQDFEQKSPGKLKTIVYF